MKTKTEIGVMPPQAKDTWCHQKLEEAGEGLPLKTSAGVHCHHLDFRPLASRRWENKYLCVKPPMWGNLLTAASGSQRMESWGEGRNEIEADTVFSLEIGGVGGVGTNPRYSLHTPQTRVHQRERRLLIQTNLGIPGSSRDWPTDSGSAELSLFPQFLSFILLLHLESHASSCHS